MLFLHGYLSNKEAWTAQIAYFSRRFKVTAIDMIGFGGAEDLTATYSVADYAAWLKEAMSALGVEKPHVIAHSFGCRVAVKCAAAENGIFDKIVLTGAAGIILPRGIGYKWKVGAYRFVKKIAPKYAEKHFGSAEYRTLSPIMKESYKKIVNEDLRRDAEKIGNPTLLVQGEGDRVTTMQEIKIYQSHLPHSRLERIEGGHFAFAEHPLPFNIITEEFLYE